MHWTHSCSHCPTFLELRYFLLLTLFFSSYLSQMWSQSCLLCCFLLLTAVLEETQQILAYSQLVGRLFNQSQCNNCINFFNIKTESTHILVNVQRNASAFTDESQECKMYVNIFCNLANIVDVQIEQFVIVVIPCHQASVHRCTKKTAT